MINAAAVPYPSSLRVLRTLFAHSWSPSSPVLHIVTHRLDVSIPKVLAVTFGSEMSHPVQELGLGSGKGVACKRPAGASLSGVLSAARACR